MNRGYWTEEKLSLLKKYLKEGYSASQTARLLGDGATRSSVIGKAKRLNIPLATQKQVNKNREGGRPKGVKPRVYPKIQPSAPAPSPVDQLFSEPPTPKLKPTKARVHLPAELSNDEYFERWVDELKPASSRPITDIPNMTRCKWITGDVKGKNATWCRKPTVDGTCWCSKHIEKVYINVDGYTGKVPKSARIRAEDRRSK